MSQKGSDNCHTSHSGQFLVQQEQYDQLKYLYTITQNSSRHEYFQKAELPTLHLSVMKSDFKCNKRILSVTQMFCKQKKEQNTHPQYHTYQHKWYRTKCSIHFITMSWCTISEDFTIHVYLFIMPLWKSVVGIFESFYWWLRAPFLSAFCFSMTTVNELKNGSCILPGSISPGSDILSRGKWTKHYDWLSSLKCKSQLAVAQPQ